MEGEPRIHTRKEFDTNDPDQLGEGAVEMERSRQEMMDRVSKHHGMVIAIFITRRDVENIATELAAFNSDGGVDIRPEQMPGILMQLGSSLERSGILE